jgi:arginyl-tRNA synthetase
MNIFNHYRDHVLAALEALARHGEIPVGLETVRIAVEPPRDPSHGDLATNAAMVLAKDAGMAPRALAERLAARLRTVDGVAEVSVAGPGFINLRLADRCWQDRLADILRAGAAYGESDIGAGRAVNVEYVSANPTGPLHIAHARGAVVGDALAALLAKAGYRVTREYYVNDAGAQVDVLARSAYLRYREPPRRLGCRWSGASPSTP